MERLCEIASPNQIRQSLQEFAHVNRGPVKVEEALSKDCDRDDATAPELATLTIRPLDVINHAGFVVLLYATVASQQRHFYTTGCSVQAANILRFSQEWLIAELFRASFGVEDGRLSAARSPPTNLPDASNTEYPVCLPGRVVTVNDLMQEECRLRAL